MPGANHPNAKTVPSKNCVRGRVVPLVVMRAKIAIPINASGHQPHGGRLNATSVPDPSATKYRDRLLLGVMRQSWQVLALQHDLRLQCTKEYQCRDNLRRQTPRQAQTHQACVQVGQLRRSDLVDIAERIRPSV